MSAEIKESCGCKGIRKCLICDKCKGNSVLPEKKAEHVYTFCSKCGLCWPDRDVTASVSEFPLYLGQIKVFEDFISAEEESLAVSEIDKIPWMPSQSGRRKQDFGPKVNFKKKKVKKGDFMGFPCFTKNILQKFKNIPELADFQPVELCHLEYTPERGSSIDPHIDDFWLWGDRLVTINLSSMTVLSLGPYSNSNCNCLKASSYFSESVDQNIVGHSQRSDILNSTSSTCITSSGLHQLYHNEMIDSSVNNLGMFSQKKLNNLCCIYRLYESMTAIDIQVKLPPRSLIVLSGCARYNWYHEIKRKDVVSRRLAMTFRELSHEFLDGKESQLGQELLSIANNFYDLD